MSRIENSIIDFFESLFAADCELIQCRRINQNSDIWILDEHMHDYMELIYFLNGEAQIKTAAGETNLTLYDVLCHPPCVKHREFVDLHKRQEIINICVKVPPGSGVEESFVLKDNTGNIRRVFRMLEYHFLAQDVLHTALEEQLLGLLFTYLCKSAHEQSHQEYSMIDRVVEYVQENYMTNITVKELSDYVHVSESYLSRLMSNCIGLPPMKYVTNVRIENAKRALKTDIPVEQIASLVGYTDPKNFSTAFRRETGYTPTKYRKHLMDSFHRE